MAAKFVTASNQFMTCPDNAAYDANGTWAFAWWAEIPIANSAIADNMSLFENLDTSGGVNGFSVTYKKTSTGGYLEVDIFPASVAFKFNNATLANGFNNGWHHWMICLKSATELDCYFDGAFVETVAGASSSYGASVNGITLGRCPIGWGAGRDLTGNIHDLRIYQNISIACADIAKILYEGRGNDNYDTGLVMRSPFQGLHGSVISATNDISQTSNPFNSFTNSPTIEMCPVY